MRKLNCMKLGKVALTAFICLHAISCSKNPEKELLDSASIDALKRADVNISAIPGNVVVTPTYNSTTFLRNPLNGWVMYGRRDATDTYWDSEFFVPQLGTNVKAIDYASACYIRTSWRSLNPSPGFYTWRDLNSQMGKLINGVKTRGLPIAFRIVVDGRDQGENTPAFVFDAGAAYWLSNPAVTSQKLLSSRSNF